MEFQQSLVEYLEHAHKGEFFSGSLDKVRQRTPLPKPLGLQEIHSIITENIIHSDYKDPIQTMTIPPLPLCNKVHGDQIISEPCPDCNSLNEWWRNFESTVDDLIVRSNTYTCRHKTDSTKKKKKKEKNAVAHKAEVKGCLNDNGVCMARFSRDIYPESKVDKEDGYIFIKKLEPWINTFTPSLTYLLRCQKHL